MSSGLDGIVDSVDAQSHSFESSTENATFQSQSSTTCFSQDGTNLFSNFWFKFDWRNILES